MFQDFCPLTDLENLNKTLDTFGVAVLPNVFTEAECEYVKKKVFDYLAREHLVFEPDDISKLNPLNSGVLHSFGISLLKEVLDMKTDDRVIEAFKKIWKQDELTTSLDGLNIQPPPEKTQKKHFFEARFNWFHTDQSSHKSEMCCVQAFINLEPTEHGDGCLSVLNNSHRYHQEFFQHFNLNTNGRDWFKINNDEHFKWFIQKGCKFI